MQFQRQQLPFNQLVYYVHKQEEKKKRKPNAWVEFRTNYITTLKIKYRKLAKLKGTAGHFGAFYDNYVFDQRWLNNTVSRAYYFHKAKKPNISKVYKLVNIYFQFFSSRNSPLSLN